jgi:hypothetical protein
LASIVARGAGVDEAANQIGVSRQTARNQLKAIFSNRNSSAKRTRCGTCTTLAARRIGPGTAALQPTLDVFMMARQYTAPGMAQACGATLF